MTTSVILKNNEILNHLPGRHSQEIISHHRMLKADPLFNELQQAYQRISELTTQSQQGNELSLREKNQLIQAWFDYCDVMLRFSRHLKKSIHTEGSDDTYQIGQLYIKKLFQYQSQWNGIDTAHLVDDEETLRKQLLLSQANQDNLAVEKFLTALEKYYQTNQNLIRTLKTYYQLAKKLGSASFHQQSDHESQKNLQQYRDDRNAFLTCLKTLKQQRHQLDQQSRQLEKRFRWFLIGPIMKYFFGQQHKMFQVVMHTIDSRIRAITIETSQRMMSKVTKFCRHHNHYQPDDVMAGEKLNTLNASIQMLEDTFTAPVVHTKKKQSKPQYSDAQDTVINSITEAKHQAKASTVQLLNAYEQSAKQTRQAESVSAYQLGQALFIGAQVQETLGLDDYRHKIDETYKDVNARAKNYHDIFGMQRYDKAKSLGENKLKKIAHGYRICTNALANIQTWEKQRPKGKEKSVEQTINIDLTPCLQLASKLADTAESQANQQPIEHLVMLRYLGNSACVRELNRKLDAQLSSYLSSMAVDKNASELPDTHYQLIPEMILRAGNQIQKTKLKRFFHRWTPETLFQIALKTKDDKALKRVLTGLSSIEQCFHVHGDDKLQRHVKNIFSTLPELIQQKAKQCQHDIKNANELHSLSQLLSSCLDGPSSLREQCLNFLNRISQGHRLLVDGNKLNTSRDESNPWGYATHIFRLIDTLDHTNTSNQIALLNRQCLKTAKLMTHTCLSHAMSGEFQKLAEFEAMVRADMYYLIFRADNITLPESDQAVTGYFLWQAVQSLWGEILKLDVPDDEDEPLDESSHRVLIDKLNRCMKCLDELHRLQRPHKDTPDTEYVPHYPQFDNAQQFMVRIGEVLKNKILDDTKHKKRLLAHLVAHAKETPNLSFLDTWSNGFNHEREQRLKAVQDIKDIDLLNQVSGELSKHNVLADQPFSNTNDLISSLENNALMEIIKSGIKDEVNRHRQQCSFDFIQLLTKISSKYLDGYTDDPRATRWSEAHLNFLKTMLNFLEPFHPSHCPSLPVYIQSAEEKLYERIQELHNKELLVAVFRTFTPQAWQADWKSFAEFDAKDAKMDEIQQRSPVKRKEKEKLRELERTLDYLISGGDTTFFRLIKQWQKIDIDMIEQSLLLSSRIADERRRLSDDYLNDLQGLEKDGQNIYGGIFPEDENNQAKQIADELDTKLASYIEKICNAIIEDVERLTSLDDDALKSSSNSKKLVLFYHRLRFIFYFHTHINKENNPIRKQAGKWLVDDFNDMMTNHEKQAGIERLIEALPDDTLTELLKVMPERVSPEKRNEFKFLINAVQKEKECKRLTPGRKSRLTPRGSVSLYQQPHDNNDNRSKSDSEDNPSPRGLSAVKKRLFV